MAFRIGQWVTVGGRLGIVTQQIGDTHTRVDYVAENGIETVSSGAVSNGQVEPVTKREQIPAPRLATMDPSWRPRP